MFPSLQNAPPAASHVIAGVMTSWTVSLALSPVWIVKTRMQLQLQPELANSASLPSQTGSYRPYTSIWDCVRRIGLEEGIRGYYKGMSASLLGASETALHFLVYEQLKMWRRAQRAERDEEAAELSPTEFLSYAAAARVVATTSVYPHETVRTRLREQRAAEPGRPHKYRGLLGTFKTIFREEGRRGLYSGMGVHLLRSVPNAAVLFATYELVSRVLRRHLYEELPFAEDDP
jgi:solute carrier family 25 protein 33/36